MKQSSKERLATLLMDELLERLSARESIRTMLGDMTSLPIDEVIEHLLVEFEQAVEQYHEQHRTDSKQMPESQNKQFDSFPSMVTIREPVAQEATIEEPMTSRSVSAPFLPSVAEEIEKIEETPPPVTVADSTSIPDAATQGETGESLDQHDTPSPMPQKSAKSSKVEKPKPTLQFDPIKLEFPKISLKVDIPFAPEPMKPEVVEPVKPAPQPAAKKEVHPKPKVPNQDEEFRKLEDLAKRIESEYTAKLKREAEAMPEPDPLPTIGEEAADQALQDELPQHEVVESDNMSEDDEEIISVEPVGSGRHMAHARYTFADDDFVYVHAVSKIPENEEPSPDPFMLEEKGIDGHSFAFALDYEGMRFYLSKINPHEMSISKAMVLLLNKQESLQLQGVHESTLNDLRGHGILLPLEFGTVARGKDQFIDIVDKNKDDLEEALDEIVKTTSWTVTASVLDGTIAGIVGTDVQTVGRDRSRNRASYTSAPQLKKFDIKVLERILQREKKIAEAVHAELSAVAKRSDVETIVGLGSGSSEDWKVILKATYEVDKRDIGKLNRTVTDLQYHHLQYDLMLSLTGDRDFLTLRRK